ncbi:hypothetical protein D3C84_1011650 [compost metagenome]
MLPAALVAPIHSRLDDFITGPRDGIEFFQYSPCLHVADSRLVEQRTVVLKVGHDLPVGAFTNVVPNRHDEIGIERNVTLVLTVGLARPPPTDPYTAIG